LESAKTLTFGDIIDLIKFPRTLIFNVCFREEIKAVDRFFKKNVSHETEEDFFRPRAEGEKREKKEKVKGKKLKKAISLDKCFEAFSQEETLTGMD